MHKPLFRIAVGSVAAVGALVVASAMPAGAATSVRAETMAQTQPDPSVTTPVTFSITTTGLLTITAPTDTQTLGTVAQDLSGTATIGATGISNFGAVTVTDNRAEAASTWTATVSSTAFTITGTSASIPADDATYDTNAVSAVSLEGFTLADITDATYAPGTPPTLTPITLSSVTPTDIVSETGYDGDNAATWSPTIIVTVPVNALVGVYTGTVTHSVS
jgi:hypothetical protein